MSKKAMKNGHADHIHANCDCTYAVSFDGKTTIKGYDPDKYKEIFQNAEGDTWNEKINSVRRMQYQENKDKINAQKRANYAEKNSNKSLEKTFTNGTMNIKQLSVSASGSITESIREELGVISIDKVDEAIKYFSDQIRNEPVEHAIVIDKTGKVIHFIGDQTGVGLYDVNLDKARVLHNHPASNGYVSFGEDDFVFIRDNPTCVFDLCNDIYDYHLEVVNDMSKLTYNVAFHMADDNMYDAAISGEDFQHVIMTKLKENGYIMYERRKK